MHGFPHEVCRVVSNDVSVGLGVGVYEGVVVGVGTGSTSPHSLVTLYIVAFTVGISDESNQIILSTSIFSDVNATRGEFRLLPTGA